MKHVLPEREYFSSVSPKGQITLPLALRQRLGIKPKDLVSIRFEGDDIVVKRQPHFSEFFMSIPVLGKPMTVEEMTETAAEEMAEEFKRKGA
jgi:AbrB family looped-hinge helix DNA binding protein